MSNSLRTDRRLRRHRRPLYRRPGRHGRIDRLPVPAPLRLAVGLRRPRRRRAWRPLPDRAVARGRRPQAALSPRHQRAADAVPRRRRRRRAVRLHARWKTRARRTTWCGGRRRYGAKCASRCAASRASTMRAPPTRPSAAAIRRCSSAGSPATASWCCACGRRFRCGSRTAQPLADFTLGADTSAWFVLEVVLAQAPSPLGAARLPE